MLLVTACLAPAAAEDTGLSASAVGYRVAVYPIDNLTNSPAPLTEIRRLMIGALASRGVQIVADEAVEQVMKRHRIRYTGGVDESTAKALKSEAGADGVLIVTLEMFEAGEIPKIALIARLVDNDPVAIRWIKSFGLAGDDKPGFLGLGIINDVHQLQYMVLTQLAASLADNLAKGVGRVIAGTGERTFQPKLFYASEKLDQVRHGSYAVMPFSNRSKTYRAGQLLMLHFIEQFNLTLDGDVRMMEPGVIRGLMLSHRIIMNQGMSYRDIDALGLPLKIDYFITGNIFDYVNYASALTGPRIDFSTMLLKAGERRVLWKSNSYNAGNDPVYVFDVGKVNTADELATKMVRAVTLKMLRWK